MTAKRRLFQSWNLDKTLSLLAFLISLGTFFLLYYQTNLTRKQQYASVMPYLEIFNRGSQADGYAFCLGNNGIGPAFIENVKIYYEDKTFQMDPADFLALENLPKDSINCTNCIHSNISTGSLIPAGEVIELLKVEESAKTAAQLRAWFGSGKATLEIVYTSIYGEKWSVSTGNFPQKIE